MDNDNKLDWMDYEDYIFYNRWMASKERELYEFWMRQHAFYTKELDRIIAEQMFVPKPERTDRRLEYKPIPVDAPGIGRTAFALPLNRDFPDIIISEESAKELLRAIDEFEKNRNVSSTPTAPTPSSIDWSYLWVNVPGIVVEPKPTRPWKDVFITEDPLNLHEELKKVDTPKVSAFVIALAVFIFAFIILLSNYLAS